MFTTCIFRKHDMQDTNNNLLYLQYILYDIWCTQIILIKGSFRKFTSVLRNLQKHASKWEFCKFTALVLFEHITCILIIHPCNMTIRRNPCTCMFHHKCKSCCSAKTYAPYCSKWARIARCIIKLFLVLKCTTLKQ